MVARNANIGRSLTAALAPLNGVMRYNTNPGPNFLVPITNATSVLALDVRAAAARALVQYLLERAQRGEDPQTLIGSLNDPKAGDLLCSIQQAVTPQGNIPPEEADRKANCDDHGKPGKGGSSTVSAGLGNLASGGCALTNAEEFHKEAARIAAMEQCVADVSAVRGNPIALTGLEEAIIGGLIVLGVEYFVVQPLQASRARSEALSKAAAGVTAEARKLDRLVNEHQAIQDKINTAQDDINRSEIAVRDAKDDVADKEQRARDAANNGTQEEARRAAEALRQSKAGLAQRELEKKNAEERLRAARAEQKAKQEEIDKQAQKTADKVDQIPNGGLDPSDAFRKSHACQEAFGFGLNERLLRQRLGETWTEHKSGLKRVGNWDPNQATPFDALGVSQCGLDTVTTETGPERCSSLVICGFGITRNDQCGCGGPPSDTTRFLQSLKGKACTKTTCAVATAKATTRGIFCDCSSGEPMDGPRPLRPVVVDTMMGTLGSVDMYPGAIAIPVVRSILDGRPAGATR
jgi:hypothetical protein